MKTDHISWRKLIFIGTLCFVMLLLFMSYQKGKQQDQKNLANYTISTKALKSAQQGNFDQALLYYHELIDEPQYKNSVALNWQIAKTLAYKGSYSESREYYERIKQIYPAILLDQKFLKDYGDLLTKINDSRASFYLSKVKN